MLAKKAEKTRRIEERMLVSIIVVSESLVQFSGFSEFGGENTQISPEFGANRANT